MPAELLSPRSIARTPVAPAPESEPESEPSEPSFAERLLAWMRGDDEHEEPATASWPGCNVIFEVQGPLNGSGFLMGQYYLSSTIEWIDLGVRERDDSRGFDLFTAPDELLVE